LQLGDRHRLNLVSPAGRAGAADLCKVASQDAVVDAMKLISYGVKLIAYGGLVSELRIPPAPGMPAGLVIPGRELIERYSHASGPGGQGVNTADSRVQLSFDVAASTVLDQMQRARLLRRLSSRAAGTVVTVVAAEFRSQRRNRVAARERLAALIRDAITPPAQPRRVTRPTRSSIDRRLTNKRRRGETKRNRAHPENA
jgi:ribosome-associated protein